MERMTKHSDSGTPCMDCEACKSSGMVCDIYECRSMLIARLSAVEDVIGTTYDLSRLKELVEADREGRVIIPPCSKGDILWTFATYPVRYVYPFSVTGVEWRNGRCEIHTDKVGSVRWEDIGKTVFLTREAAEKALEDMNA